jgi:hypothetical protein
VPSHHHRQAAGPGLDTADSAPAVTPLPLLFGIARLATEKPNKKTKQETRKTHSRKFRRTKNLPH